MNWKRRIDFAATLVAIFISLFIMSRPLAGRLITAPERTHGELSNRGALVSSVLEWRISRDYIWNRKMRTIGVLYEHQLTTELLPNHVIPLSVPSQIAGQFVSGDWVVKDSYADFYQFEARAGETVKLDAASVRAMDVDTYLLLLDPNLRPFAENDDSGSIDSNSQIDATLHQTGVWTVVVLSLEPVDEGEYTLRLTRSDLR